MTENIQEAVALEFSTVLEVLICTEVQIHFVHPRHCISACSSRAEQRYCGASSESYQKVDV